MIPDSQISVGLAVVEGEENTKTYKMSNVDVRGYIDGLEALKQAIYKIISTEKYEYPIYSFDYGIELQSLIGKDLNYVKTELKRRIEECLLSDTRIENVDNFEFNTNGDELSFSFDVVSIYGDIKVTKEVSI